MSNENLSMTVFLLLIEFICYKVIKILVNLISTILQS